MVLADPFRHITESAGSGALSAESLLEHRVCKSIY
jgi:hypothetical protein